MAKKEVEEKLNEVIKRQNKLYKLMKDLAKKQELLLTKENQELKEESELKNLESKEIDEIKQIELVEKELKKDLRKHVLRKITMKDASKAAVGAFIGIVGHFAFLEGPHLAEKISTTRATLLLIISYLITMLIVYFSGFRRVKQKRFLSIIPIRVTVIYFISIMVIILVLTVFGFINTHTHLSEIYKYVASISILASIGAGTADLIGEN